MGSDAAKSSPASSRLPHFFPIFFITKTPFFHPGPRPGNQFHLTIIPESGGNVNPPAASFFAGAWETKSSNFPPGVALCKITWYNVTNL
jgi:hypothetical protein